MSPVSYDSAGGASTSGGSNFTPNVNPGIALTNRLIARLAEIVAGFSVAEAPKTFRGPTQSPALALTSINSGVLSVPPALPGFMLAPRINSAVVAQPAPAYDITQVVYNLNRRVGADASADVTGTWTNRANAQGINNASSATSVGAVTAASRKMSLSYANAVAKTELAISLVRLHIYASKATDALGTLGSVTITYNIGGGEVALTGWNARTADFNFLTTPDTIDITSIIAGNWANLDALQTFVNHVYTNASALVTVSIDAIELEVVAAKTDSF